MTTVTTSVPVSKISPPISYKNDAIDGTLVKQNDFKLLIANQDSITDINIVDEVMVNSITTSVVNCKPIYSGEDIAVWELQMRTGNSGA